MAKSLDNALDLRIKKIEDSDGSFSAVNLGADRLTAYKPGIYSVTEGFESVANSFTNPDMAVAAHAEGYATQAAGQFAHSEGQETKALADCSHAEGSETSATGQGAHAEGF